MSFIRTVKTMVFDGALGRDPPPMRRPTRQSDAVLSIRRSPVASHEVPARCPANWLGGGVVAKGKQGTF